MIKKLIKRVAAAFLAAALCASFTVPAYADFYRQPANKKGVLINEEAQVPSVSELGASQVITNFPISWAYQQNRLNACESFFKAVFQAVAKETGHIENARNFFSQFSHNKYFLSGICILNCVPEPASGFVCFLFCFYALQYNGNL